jgi:acyl-CoA ligase (AMP-forming) (exosortase A-associated)
MAQVLYDILRKSTERYPDKVAVIHKENRIAYKVLDEKSHKLSCFLGTIGLNKGDRVCFYLEKRIEKVISIFGIAHSGSIFVPIRRQLKTNQATHIIADASAKVLITTAARAASIIKHLPKASSLTAIISLGKIAAGDLPPGIPIYYWDDIMEDDGLKPAKVHLSENDPAAILYTSGSSGMPKGVVLSHLNLIAGTRKVSQYLDIRVGDRLLSILTFGFDYGLNQLTTAIYNGAQIILIDYLFPADILRAVEKYRITGLAAVATTWIELIQTSWGKPDLKSLRYITNTGGKIPVGYVKEIRKRLPQVKMYLMYGLTEAFRSTYLDPSLIDENPGSIGKALPGEEMLLLDENDQPVTPGDIGELIHRGTLVAQGYWNDVEGTARRFRRNPLQKQEISIPETVVYSGDYVRMDQDGLLYFVGRKDELIKSAGNRISPTEIESLIHTSGMIADVVAFGIPHDSYGQVVGVVVSPAMDKSVSEQLLINFCHEVMPSFMVPGHVDIWNDLPVNANGKLDRSAIKRRAYQNLGIDPSG